jgi:transposase
MKFISQLDIPNRRELEKMMKTSATYRNRTRAHAILLSYKKYSIDAMADIFEVHRDTISRWLDSWHKFGVKGLKDAPKPGRPRVKSNGEQEISNNFASRKDEYKLVAGS